MRLLVTGGAGYIGSATAAELLARGHDVVVVDDLSQGHEEAVPEGADLMILDLLDADGVSALLGERAFDGVLHFASRTLVGESNERPLSYLRDNLVGAGNVLEAALANGCDRFILSSTANLFDQPERMPIAEDERIVPGSPYGESKFFIERTLHWLHELHGLRYACLRYFNASGAAPGRGEDHDPETHLIPLVLQVALGQRESITVFGDDYPTPDGTCVRDYIHITDLATAHVLAMERLDDLGARHYNLGNGQGFSVMEVIETARRITGHPIPHIVGPRRPGDPATLVASSAAIRDELGWEPKFPSLEAIVESAWNWHRSRG
jgi:UDP-glucose 4-epimerase